MAILPAGEAENTNQVYMKDREEPFATPFDPKSQPPARNAAAISQSSRILNTLGQDWSPLIILHVCGKIELRPVQLFPLFKTYRLACCTAPLAFTSLKPHIIQALPRLNGAAIFGGGTRFVEVIWISSSPNRMKQMAINTSSGAPKITFQCTDWISVNVVLLRFLPPKKKPIQRLGLIFIKVAHSVGRVGAFEPSTYIPDEYPAVPD
ncbi:hypothetical protein C8R44DRAFT_745157 [Mycena epipterygia]|nr:hypothetical protein C8R44DRAFT_745157 [Mycena epipterygia]